MATKPNFARLARRERVKKVPPSPQDLAEIWNPDDTDADIASDLSEQMPEPEPEAKRPDPVPTSPQPRVSAPREEPTTSPQSDGSVHSGKEYIGQLRIETKVDEAVDHVIRMLVRKRKAHLQKNDPLPEGEEYTRADFMREALIRFCRELDSNFDDRIELQRKVMDED
ncbi:hypothetical protein TH25_17800 [Thalassospira profundimaris]|uniref:Uncharacterized protein n=1 Tax=Thalassospira profundimaris TaxID=502049 RepID=A0A367WY16_9PROT|nr:hypothetical protein [Thalassospira profundimaris]RCK45610.1 hypothetical protein TH25_17800 [Thalassospira profundimaris]